MNLSEYALNELIDYVRGENGIIRRRSGRELVALFNQFGLRDFYDFNNGGLPTLEGRRNGMNTSRKDYTYDRLKQINDTNNLTNLIRFISNEEATNKEAAVENINQIIIDEGYKLELFGNDIEVIGATEETERIEVQVTFEDIQNEILRELDNAKYLVWVAVAWFTNNTLFEKLVELKERGVNIQVLIVDDEINQRYGCRIEEFESRRMPAMGAFNNNIMHNKFCIIDLITVINGSYNWSRRANYNAENITINRSRSVAERFADQFIALKTS